MTIVPVTPIDRERLVPVTSAVIVDFNGTTPAEVKADAVVIFDGVIGQNGWTSMLVSKPGGTRLVLDKLTPLAFGNVFEIIATAADTSSVTYRFQTGLRQITTSDDASVPRIAEGGPASPPPVTPTFSLALDDVVGPPVDGQAAYTFTQSGGPTWSLAGVVLPTLKSVQLNGVADALATETPTVIQPIYERTITINNVTGSTVTDASVAVVVDTAALISTAKMALNGGCEFRTTGNVLLPYWLETAANNSATTYWVKIASLPAGVTTIKMRFSASEAFPTFNDKYNAFLFFDDFSSGTIDPGRWTVTGTGFSIVSGKLRGGIANAGANHMRSVTTFPVSKPAKVVARVTETSSATNGFTTIGFFNSTADGTSILAHVDTSYYYINGSFTNFAFDGSGVGEVVDQVWMTGTQVRFKRDKIGQSYDSGFVTAALNGETLLLGARGDFAAVGPQPYTCDWSAIYARVYMDTEPTVTFSSDVVIGTGTIPAIPIPDPLKSQKFSISGWFNPSSVSAQRAIASVGRSSLKGWVLRVLATNAVEFRIFNGATSTAVTSTTIAGVGTWQHVVAVVDLAAGILRLYMNGNKEANVVAGITAAVYEGLIGFFFGKDPVAPSDQFQGRLDQWKYFNGTALTDGQVSLLLQESTGPLRTPWVGYSRDPGNIYIRKDEPLTSEVLMVPGDKVDIGYDETNNEIEIMYIHNGKVFLVTGQASENPSTLTQPSILKTDVKTGDVGTWDVVSFAKADFPPVKLAVPIEPTIVTGDTGTWELSVLTAPPTTPSATAFFGSPSIVVVGPATSSLVTSVLLFKRNYGAVVFLAEFPASVNISVYLDYAYADGDAYLTQSVYGDPGAPARKRLTAISASSAAGPGDLVTTGNVGTWEIVSFSKVDFPPLKLAVPIEPTITTGDVGHPGDHFYVRSWYPPNAAAASMGASLGGYLVISGLVQMSRQHLGVYVTVTGASNSTNNGSWLIVEIISATSVRVRALTAAGSDANNGALSWTITGTLSVAPASFVAVNTINIGVG